MEGNSLPKVSIVLPAYNAERDILVALEDLYNQSYKNREILVVDDGSTDRTLELVEKYASTHDGIVLVKREHIGVSKIRNAGIAQSSGEIVFFAESDCVYDPDYLELAINSLRENPDRDAVCVTGGPLMVRLTVATESIMIENIVQHRLLDQGKIKPFYAWVFKKGVLEKLGGFDENLFQAEDRDIFRRYNEAGYKVAWVRGIHWKHKRDQTTAELVKKFYSRGKTRVLYVLKHRLFFDLAKTLLPFWGLILGIILLFFPSYTRLVGAGLIVLVAALFIGTAAKNARIVWSSIEQKRFLLGYPIFLMARNFSSALGYSRGIASVLARRVSRERQDS